MSEAKPFDTCLVSKDDVTMDHEDICLDHIIKTEELDLGPDYLECNTDVKQEVLDMDEQTKLQYDNDDSEYTSVKIEIEIKSEIVTNDALEPSSAQEIPSDLNTEIKIVTNDALEPSSAQEIAGDLNTEIKIVTNDALEPSSAQEIPSDLNTEIKIVTNDALEPSSAQEIPSDLNTEIKIATNDALEPSSAQEIPSDLNTEIKIVTNDALEPSSAQEIPNDLNTEIKIEEMDASDTDISKGEDKTHRIKASSAEMELKPECSKTSDNKTKLKHESKMYTCNQCSYKCVKRSTIIKHLRTHKNKTFSCEFCGYEFERKYNLKRHLNTLNNEEPKPCKLYKLFCKTQNGNLTKLPDNAECGTDRKMTDMDEQTGDCDSFVVVANDIKNLASKAVRTYGRKKTK